MCVCVEGGGGYQKPFRHLSKLNAISETGLVIPSSSASSSASSALICCRLGPFLALCNQREESDRPIGIYQ